MCGMSQKRFWLEGCARLVCSHSANVLVWTLIVGALVEVTFAQECRQWQQVAINGRYGNRMAFDSNRNVTVLFGGIAPTSYGGSFGDTWEFNGKIWILRSTEGPPPRMSQGMTFDSKRNVVVMFGGYCYSYSGGGCAQANMNDTWEWDGNVWTLRATEGPSPRGSVGLAYDSKRGVTVLFGGVRQEFGELTYFNDTWEWDGNTWKQVSSIGPSPRGARATAFDSARGVIVHYGRNNEAQVMETWEWNGTSWAKKAITNPPQRNWQQMTFDSTRNVMVMHGGFGTNGFMTDTWEYDGSSWKLRDSNGPHRADYGFAFDSIRGVCVAFGHYYSDQRCGETWEWNGATWKRVSEGPFEGSPQFAFFEPEAKVVMLSNGYGSTATQWTWDGIGYQSSPTQVGVTGPITYDSNREVLVMVGGNSQTKQTWEFNGVTWLLRANNQPPIGGSLSFDIKRGVTVLFGKSAQNESQTWEWNGSEWTHRNSKSVPPPRANQGMAYDAIRHVTVMHGGNTSEALLDTWEWDGIDWTFRGESHAAGGTMFFNPWRNRVMRVAPVGSSYFGLFEWTGDEWVDSSDSIEDLPEYDNYSLHFDPSRNVYMAYGNIIGKTWEFRQAAASTGDITCDGTVNVADLLAVISAWGPCPAPPSAGNCPADIAPTGPPTGDGVVNVLDLLMVINNWN